MTKPMQKNIYEIIRFGIVGVIATAIHYMVYVITLKYLGTNIAYTTAYIISLAINFILSTKYTFKTNTNLKKGIGFLGSHLINYLLQIILLNTLIHWGINRNFAPVPVYLIVIPINYLLLKFVFKNKKFN